MTELIDILDSFDTALNQVAPNIANRLQPGLTITDIKTQTASFSWKLPQDAYVLYQWHNGLSGKPPGKLNQSISLHQDNSRDAIDLQLNRIEFERLYQQQTN